MERGRKTKTMVRGLRMRRRRRKRKRRRRRRKMMKEQEEEDDEGDENKEDPVDGDTEPGVAQQQGHCFFQVGHME